MKLWFLILISPCLCVGSILPANKIWLIFLISFSISLYVAIKLLLNSPNNNTTSKKRNLPPGPPTIPLLGNFQLLKKSVLDLESFLRKLHAKYGPILTLRVGPSTMIFISDRSMAHKALVQNGSNFSDRPPALGMSRITTSNQHTISSAGYGSLWRVLRRNLVSGVFHPSCVKSYSQGREWVLSQLIGEIRQDSNTGEPVFVLEKIQYAMFCLLLQMCFGQKLEQSTARKIEDIQRRMLVGFDISSLFPKIGKIIYRKRWNELLQMRREKHELFTPLIKARKDQKHFQNSNGTCVFSYVDSLLCLELPDEGGRKLTDGELVSLCSEFLTAGTDTTTTSLQWIMANLVKHPDVQAKLVDEIEGVVGKEAEEVREEDLNKLQYLKAVVMEGLRRHPPTHFVIPHTVSEELMFEGYVIPKDATINFMVAEMGWDESVWDDPMAFRPERFLDGGANVDITGSREIKMMPFGVGRRICPALNLAMLHLQYFVANLVREFEWKPVKREEVDLSEKLEFTNVMKNPLKAKIIERKR
ncbi:hypothetical protein MRB53_025942 [Persea americana]|uniref:Uncharacterized protein n=1 Tax=Persea americana TaxID=3435 RepID=A0ACC2LGM9_PERAE|nr:hypothetical protein MRB53_025942 [Persea americana]